jgi:hypothetical protein
MRENPRVVSQCLETLARLPAQVLDHLGGLKSRLASKINQTEFLEEPRKEILLGRLAEMPEG